MKRNIKGTTLPLLLLGLALVLALALAACAGPTGPAGPVGPAGPAGPAGTVPPATAAPPAPVVIDLGAAQTAKPGDAVTLKATVKINDASTVKSYKWTQTAGPKATLSGDTTDTLKATLADAKAVKAELFKGLRAEDRFQVQAINPHALIGADTSTFQVTVTTSSGVYKQTVSVTSTVPYAITTGLQNVPNGVPVLLSGKTQNAYSWTLVGPSGAKATLTDVTDRYPSFTPDVVGKYTVTEASSKATIDIYAGTWAGAITGVDANGRPLTGECSICHNGTIAPDKFTDWKASGHAEILTQNLNNPAGHWREACAECHTVGYNPAVDNGGFDEAMKAENWKVPAGGSLGYWENVMLKQFPKTAKLGNIQCENCHGPNSESTLHANGTLDAARISIAAEVCGSCHGEPLRHGRYQQWEESGHAGTSGTTPERAVGSAHCGRCHSGQGFLEWLKQGNLTKQIQGKNGNATAAELAALGITADKVQPITCAVCHDPHDIGTVTGEPTEANRADSAKVRVLQATAMLPAGFQAKDVGKGALCITCHNTRNAVHGDEIAIASYSAPHTAAQGDVLMGQNAYFAESIRSPHASLVDTCVTCHMESTPPPAEFSYQGSGTNHSFKASITICATCHSDAFNGKAFQA